MPYQCFADDDQEAVLLVTNLAEGDTLGVCPDHLGDWALTFLTSVSGHEWAPSGSVEPTTDEESDEDEAADGGPITPVPEQVPEAAPADEPETAESEGPLPGEEDQVAEDNAVRDAELADELAGRPRF